MPASAPQSGSTSVDASAALAAVTKRDAARGPRWVTGMPASAGPAMPAVMPGTTSKGMPACRQRRSFLAAAAEDERVAALEPDDVEPGPGEPDQGGIDVRLRRAAGRSRSCPR